MIVAHTCTKCGHTDTLNISMPDIKLVDPKSIVKGKTNKKTRKRSKFIEKVSRLAFYLIILVIVVIVIWGKLSGDGSDMTDTIPELPVSESSFPQHHNEPSVQQQQNRTLTDDDGDGVIYIYKK